MGTATPLAYTDSRGVVHPTQAESDQADRTYAAEDIFATIVDPERNVAQYATFEDMLVDRTTIEAAFAAYDP